MYKNTIVVSIVFAVILVMGLGVYCTSSPSFAMGEQPLSNSKGEEKEKIVYLSGEADSFTVWVSNNDADRTQKKMILKGKEDNNWYKSSLYYMLGGIHLKGKTLYYCDVDKPAIYSYDLLTAKKTKVLADAFYPFYVSDDGSEYVYIGERDEGGMGAFRLTDLPSEKSVDIPIRMGRRVFTRPLDILKNRYILFDANAYETEGHLIHFLYDIRSARTIDFDSAIAINDKSIAYVTSRGKDISFMNPSLNTLSLFDLEKGKAKELYHNDDIDVRYLRFISGGDAIEMRGRLATARGTTEDKPYITKPVTIIYDLNSSKVSITDGHEPIPEEDLFSNIVGIYSPDLERRGK